MSVTDPPVTDGAATGPVRVDRKLLEMLVCPVTAARWSTISSARN